MYIHACVKARHVDIVAMLSGGGAIFMQPYELHMYAYEGILAAIFVQISG
jgi:hypothetical protein